MPPLKRRRRQGSRFGSALQGALPGLNALTRQLGFEKLSGQQQSSIATRQQQAAIESLKIRLQNDVADGTKTPEQAEMMMQALESGLLPDFDALAPAPSTGLDLGFKSIKDVSEATTEELRSTIPNLQPGQRDPFARALETREAPLVSPSGQVSDRMAGFRVDRETGDVSQKGAISDLSELPPFPEAMQAEIDREKLTAAGDLAAAQSGGAERGIRELGPRPQVPITKQSALSQGFTRAFSGTALEGQVGAMVGAIMTAQRNDGDPVAAIAAVGRGGGFDPVEFDRQVALAFKTANEILVADRQEPLFQVPGGVEDPGDQGDPGGAAPDLAAIAAKINEAGSLSVLSPEERTLWDKDGSLALLTGG